MTHVTCRLTVKNRDQLRNPTLGNRVRAIPFNLSTTLSQTLVITGRRSSQRVVNLARQRRTLSVINLTDYISDLIGRNAETVLTKSPRNQSSWRKGVFGTKSLWKKLVFGRERKSNGVVSRRRKTMRNWKDDEQSAFWLHVGSSSWFSQRTFVTNSYRVSRVPRLNNWTVPTPRRIDCDIRLFIRTGAKHRGGGPTGPMLQKMHNSPFSIHCQTAS